MCEVVVTFESDLIAAKACELLSLAFPMLTFELRPVPELNFNDCSGIDWSNVTTSLFGDVHDKQKQ